MSAYAEQIQTLVRLRRRIECRNGILDERCRRGQGSSEKAERTRNRLRVDLKEYRRIQGATP